jgi:FdhD protein
MECMELVSQINVKKYNSSIVNDVEDLIIVERPLNIFINNQHYVTLMCSPSLIEELAVGFLFSEGVINTVDDVEKINIVNEESIFITLNREITSSFGKDRALVSGCAKGSIHINMLNEKGLKKIDSNCNFEANLILKWMNNFNKMPTLFQQTGGVHSCSICGNEGVEFIAEDIGRHNALDKLIGKSLIEKKDLKNKMLFTSGRVSSDILVKAARAQIPVLVSHSAPTNLVVSMAKNINLTLIGFARGNRMNIYCGSNRIQFI